MKRIFFTSVLAVGALFFATSCQKALDDIQPNGSTLSLEQLHEGAVITSDRAESGLIGLYAHLNQYESVYAMQGDFGYPSFVARLEHAGDNVVSTTHGYNWFNRELRLSDFQVKTSTTSNWAWTATYKNIKFANEIIAFYIDKKDDPAIAPILGQAKAMRAWDYFLLAQLFAKTYKGNESAPCVPLVSHDTDPAVFSNNPRRTVQEVYDFILADLNEAANFLKDVPAGPKNQISEAVVYGIRSRVHLVMNNWAAAEADAKKAIELFSGRPFSIEEVSIPNFDDVQAGANSMWGIIITNEDKVTKTGIANWTSMFTSLCFAPGGYTTMVGTYKRINTRLWDRIPATDIRKEWWVHRILFPETNILTSKLIENAYSGQTNLAKEYEADGLTDDILVPYLFKGNPLVCVKFAPTDKKLVASENSVDFQLMRVEEMYYNLAEAQAMGGNVGGGVATLTDFVKTYRDPDYAFTAASAKEVQDEIYFQKRVEFWGEGISWFDMIRMNKGIERVDLATNDNGGYPPLCRFNVPAGDPTFTFQIPLNEEQNNKAIEGNNNPPYVAPKDMM